MNWNEVEGKWNQMKGSVKEKFGKLTDDDLKVIAGKKDQFLGKVQERYGIAREQAEKDVDTWLKSQKTDTVRTFSSGAQGAETPRTHSSGGGRS
jgi:uncharacterized protein YjbJ (UPF0337 family)